MKLGTKEIPALRLGADAVLKVYLGGSQVWPLGFDPASLFAANEQGVWYDPSDFSTMFQDADGTVPVTAVEQPVGLMLDKSQGLVLGPELVTNGAFDTDLSGWSVGASYSWVSGRMFRVGGASDSTSQSITTKIGSTYEVVVDYEVVANNLRILWGGTVVSQPTGTGRYRSFLVATGTSTIIAFAANVVGSSYYIDNISVKEVPGNHASQPTATSRPVLRQDGNGKHYLYFDGVDDFLVTPTITPGIDKVQVFAGARKLSDAATGVIAESSVDSSGNSGSFALFAPNTSADYGWRSRGTDGLVIAPNGFTSPITNTLTGLGDIHGDTSTVRVNGSQATQSTVDQGTGNFLAYPLYIGRRGGTTLPFNGHLYSLIVRFGSNLPIAAIEQAEAWINSKTGAY